MREEKAAAEMEVQRCYYFDEQIQTHHVAVNQQIVEASATEIKRLEVRLQEAKKAKSAQQEKARKVARSRPRLNWLSLTLLEREAVNEAYGRETRRNENVKVY